MLRMQLKKSLATPTIAYRRVLVGLGSGASAANLAVGVQRTAPSLCAWKPRACLQFHASKPMATLRPRTATCTIALKVMSAQEAAIKVTADLIDNEFVIDY
jgi:hypothetical protein